MAHLTKVLLPAPFSPSSAWKAPDLMRSETLSSAASAPKCLEKPTSSSDGAPSWGIWMAPITLMAGTAALRAALVFCGWTIHERHWSGAVAARASSRQGLQHRSRVGDGAEHAALHLDHLQ